MPTVGSLRLLRAYQRPCDTTENPVTVLNCDVALYRRSPLWPVDAPLFLFKSRWESGVAEDDGEGLTETAAPLYPWAFMDVLSAVTCKILKDHKGEQGLSRQPPRTRQEVERESHSSELLLGFLYVFISGWRIQVLSLSARCELSDCMELKLLRSHQCHHKPV